MSKFELVAQQVQIIKTADGKEFNSMEEAVAHQTYLENKEGIDRVVESFLNSEKLIDRNRKQKAGVAATVVGFLIAQGVDLSVVADVERTAMDTPAPEVVEVPADEAAADADAGEAPADSDVADAGEEAPEFF